VTATPRRTLAARLTLAGLFTLTLAGCGAAVLPQVHSEAERLATAQRLIERRDFTNAAELLKTYIQNNGGGANVDVAIYQLGVADLGLKEYETAQADFERLTRDFPESDSAASAAFMVGEALWGTTRGPDFDQEPTRKALAQWQGYLRDHPGHWRNAQARERIVMARGRLARKTLDTAMLYWKLRYTESARLYYNKVVDDYGDLPLVGDAFIGLALCDARDGRRDQALAALKDLETRFTGTPMGVRAQAERLRVEQGRVKATKKPKPRPVSEGAPGMPQ
jgi:outer membrane assembly lipoprotein YfiO